MDKEKAKEYLKRKGKPQTNENVEEVMKRGKIYGDPIAEVQ
jgi:hypothetical protein